MAWVLLLWWRSTSACPAIRCPDLRNVVHLLFRRRYNQFLVCLNENDGDKSACKKIDYLTRATCPVAWLAEWKEQREEGTFPGVASPHLPDDDEE